MILKALALENFKGIREPVRIEFAPVTLLFGPNNAGKSTIVQALHYALELFERRNPDPGRTFLGGDIIDLGGFGNLVHNHDQNRAIRLLFELDLSGEDLIDYAEQSVRDHHYSQDQAQRLSLQIQNCTVQVSVQWSNIENRPLITQYEIGINEQPLGTISTSDDGRRIVLSYLNFSHSLFLVETEEPVQTSLFEDEAEHVEIEQPMLFEIDESENWLASYFSPEVLLEEGESSENLHIELPQETVLPSWSERLAIPDEALDSDVMGQSAPDSHSSVDPVGKDNIVGLLSILLVGPGIVVTKMLSRLRYIGPLRSVPGRNHQPARSPDEFRWSNGLAAWDLLLLKGSSLVDSVNTWLTREDRLNSGYRLEVKRYKELEVDDPAMIALQSSTLLDDEELIRDAIQKLPEKQRLLIRDERNNVELSPHDLGVGISQMIPVLVAALHTQTGTVAIEEPESSTHPAFQVVLGDLFISQANEKPDLMFLIETHSEHLMLRFLRRIRETSENELPPGMPPLTPGGIAVYFVEPSETGPRIHRIRIDKEGDFIDHWPRGFFTERMKELYGE